MRPNPRGLLIAVPVIFAMMACEPERVGADLSTVLPPSPEAAPLTSAGTSVGPAITFAQRIPKGERLSVISTPIIKGKHIKPGDSIDILATFEVEDEQHTVRTITTAGEEADASSAREGARDHDAAPAGQGPLAGVHRRVVCHRFVTLGGRAPDHPARQ